MLQKRRVIKRRCKNFYIGESGRRIEERVFDHAGRDRNSHVYKHGNVTIINSNFSNYYKRKVLEAIYIKQKRPILNIQDTSVPLKLLNWIINRDCLLLFLLPIVFMTYGFYFSLYDHLVSPFYHTPFLQHLIILITFNIVYSLILAFYWIFVDNFYMTDDDRRSTVETSQINK